MTPRSEIDGGFYWSRPKKSEGLGNYRVITALYSVGHQPGLVGPNLPGG